MRKTISTLIALFLLWIGYTVWPLYDLYRLVNAFETRDVATLTGRINFGNVRQSLTKQVMDAYIRRSGIRIGATAQSMVLSAMSIADPVVNKLISPEALAALMTTGWPTTVVPDVPPGTVGISSRSIGAAWQIFAGAEYGIGRFDVAVPVSFPPTQRFGLSFRLRGWRWHLVGIALPENIQNVLADELIRITKTPPRSQ